MRAAAGTFGKPGMVMILPHIATIKPAPADNRNSLTVILKFLGLPVSLGLSDNDLGVLATQMGNFS